MSVNRINKWQYTNTRIFWNQIASSHHSVQIYESDKTLIDTLAEFVRQCFSHDESSIVIATAGHLQELNSRLKAADYDLEKLIAEHRYIPLDARATLDQFMSENGPDKELFYETMRRVYANAIRHGKVKAYGEMVSILWVNGQTAATIKLEELWNEFRAEHPLSLYCAYPKSAFQGEDAKAAIQDICNKHSHMIDGTYSQDKLVYYKQMA